MSKTEYAVGLSLHAAGTCLVWSFRDFSPGSSAAILHH